ncbi:hypothetical protein EV207_103202 [Scopulibacillus darangshiensis]|uniref:Uncharacterized protein n=1 Tax=Scopulibacillus darangshiensis TaxID=442528 RepID=A0A4R2P8W6_9BACL|nr:hypothetical protein [Scopulibacillus darangshiensis]TCP31317.1 hypothetical protein EV207_103202 [Scopulibacillus darangshiensis]
MFSKYRMNFPFCEEFASLGEASAAVAVEANTAEMPDYSLFG